MAAGLPGARCGKGLAYRATGDPPPTRLAPIAPSRANRCKDWLTCGKGLPGKSVVAGQPAIGSGTNPMLHKVGNKLKICPASYERALRC